MDHRKADFELMVEAVRHGTIFAHSGKQYGAWKRSSMPAALRKGLTGQALENAIAALRVSHPEYVTTGTYEG